MWHNFPVNYPQCKIIGLIRNFLPVCGYFNADFIYETSGPVLQQKKRFLRNEILIK
jgi:hypothetical protein